MEENLVKINKNMVNKLIKTVEKVDYIKNA